MKQYTRTHEWVELRGDKAYVGITAHAAEELGEIVYVELPEIGAQAGFATGTSFTRQFKKAFGTTPGQWRIKMSKKTATG